MTSDVLHCEEESRKGPLIAAFFLRTDIGPLSPPNAQQSHHHLFPLKWTELSSLRNINIRSKLRFACSCDLVQGVPQFLPILKVEKSCERRCRRCTLDCTGYVLVLQGIEKTGVAPGTHKNQVSPWGITLFWFKRRLANHLGFGGKIQNLREKQLFLSPSLTSWRSPRRYKYLPASNGYR